MLKIISDQNLVKSVKLHVINLIIIKILWDFEIQTDHLIQARRPDFSHWKENQRI